MSTNSRLKRLTLATAFAAGTGLVVAAGPAGAHGGGHWGSQRSGFVNTIHPIVYHPPLNAIRPIVRPPIVTTIHPIVGGVTATFRPVLVHPPIYTGVGTLAPPTGPIVRDHRGGSQGEGGVTITSVPRPPSSSSLCIVSCGAYLGTPTYYNAGNTIRDHRTNPGNYGN